MKASDMKNMSNDSLKEELIASLREQFNLRMQKGTRQLARTHLLKVVRRKIARLKTILRENGNND